MRLRLTGITRKGKNRVHQFGTEWRLIRFSNDVVCLNGARGMFIEPISSPENVRWIRAENDPDFKVEILPDGVVAN